MDCFFFESILLGEIHEALMQTKWNRHGQEHQGLRSYTSTQDQLLRANSRTSASACRDGEKGRGHGVKGSRGREGGRGERERGEKERVK